MPPTNASPQQPVQVLVIDDDAVLRELLFALLSMKGHTVVTAEGGEEALRALQGGTGPEVILTDVQLPGLTGPELIEQLRAAAPEALLLGMSGSEPGPKARGAFDGFLLKPFSAEDFDRAVTAALHADSNDCKEASRTTSPANWPGTATLDEDTYGRLAASLPAAQLSELYSLTLDDADSRIQRLSEAHSSGDRDMWRREAHALKGGCSMVGATELAMLAARAEKGPTMGTPHLGDFAAAAKRLRSNVSERFGHST